MAMPFTHHTVKRSSVGSPAPSVDSDACSSPKRYTGGEDGKPRIALCTNCYEGRGDLLLYLPRRKCKRCTNCAEEHMRAPCFLAKCVFCGESAVAPRLEGNAMWYACEKHRYFTFHPEKWKPLPLSMEEKASIRRYKTARLLAHSRRLFLSVAFMATLYFVFLRGPLRRNYGFDAIDFLSPAWSMLSEAFTGIMRIGMDVAQAL